MASAFKDYEEKGIIIKSSFDKVSAISELTKKGDFVVKAKSNGNVKGVNYCVDAKSKNLSNIDISAELEYTRKFNIQRTAITTGTKVNVGYDDIQEIDFKKMYPAKFSVSETIKTDISSSTLTYKLGEKQKLEFENKMNYKLGMVDVNLNFPKIDFLDKKNVKELAEEAEVALSTSINKLSVGVKAGELGKSLQLLVEDKFGFFKGKTIAKVDLPNKNVKTAFERELVVCKNLSLASRFSFDNCKSVNKEYGFVLKNNNDNLVIRGSISSKGCKKIAIDHKVSNNVTLHMVGTTSGNEGRKVDHEEGNSFAVGITFDA